MLGFLKSNKQPAGENPAGWLTRLKAGLSQTRDKLGSQLGQLLGRHAKIGDALYEELETILIGCDIGVAPTEYLLAQLKQRVARERVTQPSEVKRFLKECLLELLSPLSQALVIPPKKPFVILVAGVNGAGKTTSIGKLAWYFRGQGKSIMLAAGDTFRAAAVEQLRAWGERNQITVISQQDGDPAAVIFDTLQSAIAKGTDIVLADTAGRLPTQLHLMDELKKVKRVVTKVIPDAPHEVLLVLDANTGQNAVAQVKAFDDALGLTGLVLTKLDGTAKGGAIAGIARHKPIPLRFVGVGEDIDDLRPFNAKDYVDALFD
ncbi:MAG: signal recognition particle-docking protein FtsY [Betaproteobacteria bacterium]|nr:signal recognition particle-docking protein FtsY [Betaproteobacteria bacterium]